MANDKISGQITNVSGTPISNAKGYLWREDLSGFDGVVEISTADDNGNSGFNSHPDATGDTKNCHNCRLPTLKTNNNFRTTHYSCNNSRSCNKN